MIEFNIPKDSLQRIFAVFDGYPEIQASLLEDVANSVKKIIEGVSPIGLDYRAKEVSKTGKTKKGTGGWFRRSTRQEGTLKTSWSPVEAMGGGFGFYAGVPYASVLEYGEYRGVGPRTVANAGGIYSTQAPEGMARPLFEGKTVGAGYTIDKVIKQAVARMKKTLSEKAG